MLILYDIYRSLKLYSYRKRSVSGTYDMRKEKSVINERQGEE